MRRRFASHLALLFGVDERGWHGCKRLNENSTPLRCECAVCATNTALLRSAPLLHRFSRNEGTILHTTHNYPLNERTAGGREENSPRQISISLLVYFTLNNGQSMTNPRTQSANFVRGFDKVFDLNLVFILLVYRATFSM